MPTTPVSVSAGIPGLENTTIYTVPAGKTAIVKAVIGQTPNNSGTGHTVSKFVNGQNFPLNYNQSPVYTAASGASAVSGANLITAPITMAAGEQLKVYVGANSVYNFPSVVTNTNQSYAADGSLATIATMVYGNSIYMASGYSNSGVYVATSTDAITWTQKTSAVSLASNMDLLAYANGIWVGAKQYATGNIFYSTDNGNTWAYATGVSSYNPYCVYSGNNTLVISSAGTVIYSTNGSTWTESTTLSALNSASGVTVNNVGWTGTHWIITTAYGNYATTDFVTYYGFGSLRGNNQGNNNQSHNNIEYSSYYGKYYACRNAASAPNIFSSSNGLLWSNIGSVSQNPAKIAVAGNNPILIGCPSSSGTVRYKSTDGITFTASSDSSSYSGKVWGLANGYFLTFQTLTGGQCYLSTDPTTGAGSTSGGGSAPDFTAKSAAADPITGKWCVLGKDVGSNRWITLGGTSGTNIGSAYLPGLNIDSTVGNPMAVAWSAADNAFYSVSDTGQIRRATAYNSSWTLVNSGTIQQQYNSNTPYAIKVVGTTIYVFLGTNATYANYMWVGSTLTGGTSFTAYNQSSNYQYAYNKVNWVQANGIYTDGDAQVATDGTYLLLVTGPGTITAYNPSAVATEIVSPPTSVGTVQQAGSYSFAYGGYNTLIAQNNSGVYYSTNIITTFGRWNNMTSPNQFSENNKPPNKILYLGGVYYLNSFSSTGYMYAGTSPSTLDTGKQTGSSIAGVTVVQPNTGFASDGTNMVGFQTRIGNTMKTTTPASFLYGSTVTASIVEID